MEWKGKFNRKEKEEEEETISLFVFSRFLLFHFWCVFFSSFYSSAVFFGDLLGVRLLEGGRAR